MDQLQKTRTFRKWIATAETFVLPEAWDVASARILVEAGFKCVGASSRIIAWSAGHGAGERVKTEVLLGVAARIARAVPVPVNADLDGSGAVTPAQIHRSVRAALAAGCVGVTVGDGRRNGGEGLVPVREMAAVVHAARKACSEAGMRAVITVRTEALTFAPGGGSPFEEAIRRAGAYFDAGADCVLVPGAQHLQVVERLAGVIGGPLAISVALPSGPDLKAYSRAGVACVTLGTGLMRAALGSLRQRSEELVAFGNFTHLERAIPADEFKALMEPPDAQSEAVREA